MDIYSKVNGPTGVKRHIENIIGHTDADSRVRLAALDQIIKQCEDGKAEILKAVEAEIAAAMAPAEQA